MKTVPYRIHPPSAVGCLVFLAAGFAPVPLRSADSTWIGGSHHAERSNPANWEGRQAPVAEVPGGRESLVFSIAPQPRLCK